MRRTIERSLLVSDRDRLIEKLVAAGYPFAVWRMPNTSKFRFILSLGEAFQTEQPIHTLDKGFVLNLYDDNHPKKPFFIASDLEITEDEITVDPRINDSKLETFFDQLVKVPKRSFNEQVTVNNESGDFFESKVALAVECISQRQFEKVVLSRYEDVTLGNNFPIWNFFQKMSNAYPNAFCSISHLPGRGLWIGASPELLISDNDDRFRTVSLAGTKSLQENQELKEIAWTHKEIEEQALVSRYIINCFKKLRLREFHEQGPKTVRSGRLAHLKTTFEVRYGELSFDGLSDQMLELLHPTSAVCGMPIDRSKPWIQEIEGYDREFYAGFLGPVNYETSTDLYVNLRCMKISGSIARLYAGAGITEDSNPQKELEETRLKMNTMRSLINTYE